MTHSIPEANALVIFTRAGTVLHTGDWKLDDRRIVGETYNRRRLDALGVELLGSVDSGRPSLQADGRLEAVASDVREDMRAEVH